MTTTKRLVVQAVAALAISSAIIVPWLGAREDIVAHDARIMALESQVRVLEQRLDYEQGPEGELDGVPIPFGVRLDSVELQVASLTGRVDAMSPAESAAEPASVDDTGASCVLDPSMGF